MLEQCDKINNNTIIEILTNCKHLSSINIHSKAIYMKEACRRQCDELTSKCYRRVRLIYAKYSVLNS